MHQPPLFRETRTDVMQALMRTHPFALLITTRDGTPSADHLPLVLHSDLSEQGVLRGHVAASNPLAQIGHALDEVLAVFQGPHAYVSPGWYPSKAEHGKVVPTWNYAVVHARGPLTLHRDPDWSRAHLEELTHRHEHHRTAPWMLNDAPDDFIARQMRALVGLEIRITTLDGTWKTSQNKSDADRDGVHTGLQKEPSEQAQDMAHLVANIVR